MSAESLEVIYFIAQIIAALALIGSLIFVGSEVRHNTISQNLQMGMDRTALANKVHSWLIENENLREVLIKGAPSYNSLSTSEKMVFASFYQHWLSAMILIWAHEENGLVDRKHSEPFYLTTSEFVKLPGVREWWIAARRTTAVEFRERFDALFEVPASE